MKLKTSSLLPLLLLAIGHISTATNLDTNPDKSLLSSAANATNATSSIIGNTDKDRTANNIIGPAINTTIDGPTLIKSGSGIGPTSKMDITNIPKVILPVEAETPKDEGEIYKIIIRFKDTE